MNSSEVRKFIKQGEQATEALEKLGYTYSTKPGEHPHWVAPVNVLDPIVKALEDLLREQLEARLKEAQTNDPRGLNWHIVSPLIGQNFKVRQENIPASHLLSGYGAAHFVRHFKASDIQYRRSPEYTGYAVLFDFQARFLITERIWLPLSACAFK